MSTVFKGIAASSGIAIGKAYLLLQPDLSFKTTAISNAEEEIYRLHSALYAAKSNLEFTRQQTGSLMGKEEAAIYEAQRKVLNESDFLLAITNRIKNNKVSAETALDETAIQYMQFFEQSEDERTSTINALFKRILGHLLGARFSAPALIAEQVVVVAEDLNFYDMAQLNKRYVQGFATNTDYSNSYVAHIASSNEIPAVVGVKDLTSSIEQGDLVIVDGVNGDVHVNPTPEIVRQYTNK